MNAKFQVAQWFAKDKNNRLLDLTVWGIPEDGPTTVRYSMTARLKLKKDDSEDFTYDCIASVVAFDNEDEAWEKLWNEILEYQKNIDGRIPLDEAIKERG